MSYITDANINKELKDLPRDFYGRPDNAKAMETLTKFLDTCHHGDYIYYFDKRNFNEETFWDGFYSMSDKIKYELFFNDLSFYSSRHKRAHIFSYLTPKRVEEFFNTLSDDAKIPFLFAYFYSEINKSPGGQPPRLHPHTIKDIINSAKNRHDREQLLGRCKSHILNQPKYQISLYDVSYKYEWGDYTVKEKYPYSKSYDEMSNAMLPYITFEQTQHRLLLYPYLFNLVKEKEDDMVTLMLEHNLSKYEVFYQLAYGFGRYFHESKPDLPTVFDGLSLENKKRVYDKCPDIKGTSGHIFEFRFPDAVVLLELLSRISADSFDETRVYYSMKGRLEKDYYFTLPSALGAPYNAQMHYGDCVADASRGTITDKSSKKELFASDAIKIGVVKAFEVNSHYSH
jgi:hypothetical protein